MAKKLHSLRKKLDTIDQQLLQVLAERKRAVSEVVETKIEQKQLLRDKTREAEHIAELIGYGRKLGLDAYFITKLFQQIIDYSLQIQQQKLMEQERVTRDEGDQIVVAFQGVEGAYSYLAGQKYFTRQLDRVVFRGLPTFKAILESVDKGSADYAVLPIENTTAGSINESYDLLSKTRLSIVGEEILPIHHCLMAVEKVPLAQIRRIYSHPKALEQCSQFLSELEHCTVESFIDTAMAIQKIKEDNDLSAAAIGSEMAAELYGVEILKKGIANSKENYTRFFIVAKEPVSYDLRIPCKTSMILTTKHVEGALVHCLNILAKHHLNLSKLESRPKPHEPWEYLFYIDFDGNIADPKVKAALDELSGEVSYLKILGCYPARTGEESRPVDAQSILKKSAAIPEREPGKQNRKNTDTVTVFPGKDAYKLASRGSRPDDTIIRVRDVLMGGDDFVVIAGPCSVESEEQIMQAARAVKEAGANILRGGVFKPRTSPYSFQGMGYEGLTLLREAGLKFDLPIITEVVHPQQLDAVAEEADILQVGARNMQNFALLREIGQINKPVFLKRGMMASIDELLSAAEYILSQGNQQVILCERGIRTFETATRNTLDIAAVPVLKYRTHLPVFVDPSHAAGDWRWVAPLAEAAVAAGADGIMVEVHPDPAVAKSDGEQSLTFANFQALMEGINKLRRALTTQDDA